MSTKTIILSPSHSVNTGDDIGISDWTKLALSMSSLVSARMSMKVSTGVRPVAYGSPIRCADLTCSRAIALFRSSPHGTSFHVPYM